MITKFNVRVYFILFNDNNTDILVADEIIQGNYYTKFPGGGLEFGEGPVECAKREALEELGQEIEVTGHYYTTDFFIPSAFRQTDQVISIYFKARLIGPQQFRSSETRFDFSQTGNDEESFRWVSISHLHLEDFQFPGDKKVVEMILKQSDSG